LSADLSRARRGFPAPRRLAPVLVFDAPLALLLLGGKRRARAVSRGPAPPPDRAHRRSRAYARRARPRGPPSRVEDRPRAGGRGDRDSTPQDEGGARCARSGQARSAPRTHPCAASRSSNARCARGSAERGSRSSDSRQAACRKLLDGQSLSADSRAQRAARVASKLIELTAREGERQAGGGRAPGDGAPRPNDSPLSAFVPGLSENSRGLWRRDTMSNAIINPLSAAKPPSH